jgi:hypothetical protein
MRRAATLEDQAVHGALDGYLASLYIAGGLLALLVLESSGMKGSLRRQGRVRGVCRKTLKRVHQRQVSNFKA